MSDCPAKTAPNKNRVLVPRSPRSTIRWPMPSTMRSDQRFRPRERLRLEQDFERVIKTGRKASDGLLLVFAAENRLGWSRLGISIPKRIGNSVRRHYVRRRIREAFRRNKDKLPTGLDLVCVARPGAAVSEAAIETSLIKLITKAAFRA